MRFLRSSPRHTQFLHKYPRKPRVSQLNNVVGRWVDVVGAITGESRGEVVAARRHKVFGDSNGVIKLNSICLSIINNSRNASGFGSLGSSPAAAAAAVSDGTVFAILSPLSLSLCTHHARVGNSIN